MTYFKSIGTLWELFASWSLMNPHHQAFIMNLSPCLCASDSILINLLWAFQSSHCLTYIFDRADCYLPIETLGLCKYTTSWFLSFFMELFFLDSLNGSLSFPQKLNTKVPKGFIYQFPLSLFYVHFLGGLKPGPWVFNTLQKSPKLKEPDISHDLKTVLSNYHLTSLL